MIKAIFWDNDGVLVDTEYVYYEANKRLFKRFDIDLSIELFQEYNFIRGVSILDKLKELGYNDDEILKIRSERDVMFAEMLNEKRRELLMPGVKESVSELSKDYIMGIVTSTKRMHFDVIHQCTGILKNFKFILTAEDYNGSKPNPAPYLKAVERSGVPPSQCTAVEDTERGLRSALAAGIKCVVIPHPLTRCCNFRDASAVAETVSGLKDILSNL